MHSEDYGITKRSYIESKVVMWKDAVTSYLVQIEELEEKIVGAHESIVDLEQELYEINTK